MQHAVKHGSPVNIGPRIFRVGLVLLAEGHFEGGSADHRLFGRRYLRGAHDRVYSYTENSPTGRQHLETLKVPLWYIISEVSDWS